MRLSESCRFVRGPAAVQKGEFRLVLTAFTEFEHHMPVRAPKERTRWGEHYLGASASVSDNELM